MFENSTLDLPFTCAEFSITGPIYNPIIQDFRGLPSINNKTILGGASDVQIGFPTVSTIPSLFIGPYKMTWAAAAPTSGSWTQVR